MLSLLGACALPPRPAASAPPAERIADGVYLVRGAPGEPEPANLGRVGNSGFIVGPGGVLAVDAGTSHAHGQALLAAIRQVTAQPVRAVVITHVRQEFLFGAGAFQQAGAAVWMHRRAHLLMKARCENCLKTLRQTLGEPALAGTALVSPDRLLDASETTALIGRPVRLHWFGHSSGPGDLAVEDLDSRSVFAGGLLDAGRVPDVQDSDLPGWHRALAGLQALGPRQLVPGHGPASDAGLIGRVDTYLRTLETHAAALVKAGTALSEVPDALELPAYTTWDQYDPIHRRNASIVFLRLEREELLRPEGVRP